jgi:hypothetical protein
MISRKDCKCPCHRFRHGVIHVVPCCDPRDPGSDLVPRPSKRSKDTKRTRKVAVGTVKNRWPRSAVPTGWSLPSGIVQVGGHLLADIIPGAARIKPSKSLCPEKDER